MASSEETPADIISENQESEQPESEESSEAFNCEGLDHCYDTEDNLDRHLTDGEWSQCDHIVCPHRYSGSTNFELAEWALYPASWQESLEFSTWFLSRGLLPEPHNLTALPVDTGLNSWVPSVAASALQSQVHTPASGKTFLSCQALPGSPMSFHGNIGHKGQLGKFLPCPGPM